VDSRSEALICEEIGFDLLVFIYALNAGDLTCLEVEDPCLIAPHLFGPTHVSVDTAGGEVRDVEHAGSSAARTSSNRQPV
jgi:hypothetical protein